MKNTHITNKHKSALRFSLLAVFFMLFLRNTNSSQAMMKERLQQKPDAVEIDQNNNEQSNLQVKQNRQNIFSQSKKFVQKHKALMATGVFIAAGIALAYSYLKPAAISPDLSTNAQAIQSTAVVSSAPTSSNSQIEQMTYNDSSWFSSTDDISESLNSIWNIARTGISAASTVPAAVVVPPAASTTSASNPAAAQEGAADQQSMWRTFYNAATKYPRISAIFGLGTISYLLYKYFGFKINKRTFKDGVSGMWMAPTLGAPFLTTSQILPFTVLAVPAAIIGNKLFQWSKGHEKLEKFVTKQCTKLLPNRDTMKGLYPKILPGKEIVDNFFNNYWGSAPNDDGNTGNDAARAAEYIGIGIADLFGSFLGVVGLLFIFKFLIWYYQKPNNHTPKQAPASTNTSQAEVQQQQQTPKKATTALGDSLLLHIIYALGLADIAYTLVDKVIEKLEQDAEKYTQHQRYNPKSKFTEVKEKVTGKFGSIAAKWPFN